MFYLEVASSSAAIAKSFCPSVFTGAAPGAPHASLSCAQQDSILCCCHTAPPSARDIPWPGDLLPGLLLQLLAGWTEGFASLQHFTKGPAGQVRCTVLVLSHRTGGLLWCRGQPGTPATAAAQPWAHGAQPESLRCNWAAPTWHFHSRFSR